MSLAVKSQHDGLIRFYREPQRNGGDVLAVFPPVTRGDDWRMALGFDAGGLVYVEVPLAYIRNGCRPADGTSAHDMREALALLERIDQRSAYVLELERAAR